MVKKLIVLLMAMMFAFSLAGVAFSAEAMDQETICKCQHWLESWGMYQGECTGELTPETASAVKAFQEEQGLTCTGILDEETVQAMEEKAAKEGATEAPAQ